MFREKRIITIMLLLTSIIYLANIVTMICCDRNYLRLRNTFWIADENCEDKNELKENNETYRECILSSGNLWFTRKEAHYIMYPYAEEDVEDYFCFFGEDSWVGDGKSKSTYKVKGNIIYSKCTRGKHTNYLKTRIVKLKNNKLTLKIRGKNKTFTKHNTWRILKWRY